MSLTQRGSSKGDLDECQDRAAHWVVEAFGLVVLAVADGAGSASLGGEGADLFVQNVSTHLADLSCDSVANRPLGKLAETFLVVAVESARAELEKRGVDSRLFDATVGLAFLSDEEVAISAIGDVFACVRSQIDSTDVKLVLSPERSGGRGDDGGAHFYTRPNWRSHVQTVTVADPAVDAVFLSTDGLEDVALQFGYPADDADVVERGAQVVEVRLVPEIFAIVDRDFDARRLAMDINDPGILDVKGDDVGFALARRRQS
jgi:Protein phosphatase 2C